jgi:hypothetical protein
MTSLAVTDIDLINRALVNLGETTITDLTDEDTISVSCATVYPSVRDEVLGLYPWRCTLKRARLARLSTAPENEWTYAFQLPSDRIGEPRTVWNTSKVGAEPFKLFDLEGDTLVTDAAEIWVEYPWLINEANYSAHLRTLIVFVLSARLAEPVTEDSSKSQYWEMKAYGTPSDDGMGGYFARARLMDSQGRPSQEMAADYSLINVRG